MKYFFKILFAVVAVFCINCFVSCSQSIDDNSIEDEGLTEADLFVNSDEFKEFELLLTARKKEIKRAILSLDNYHRNKLRGYLWKLKRSDSGIVKQEMMDSVQTLLNIDFSESWKPVYAASNRIVEGVSGDVETFIKALQKRNSRIQHISRSDSEAEIAYSNCLSNCDERYYISIIDCQGLGSGMVGGYGWSSYELCMDDKMDILLDCYFSCETVLQ